MVCVCLSLSYLTTLSIFKRQDRALPQYLSSHLLFSMCLLGIVLSDLKFEYFSFHSFFLNLNESNKECSKAKNLLLSLCNFRWKMIFIYISIFIGILASNILYQPLIFLKQPCYLQLRQEIRKKQ
jgi:hypothetical protein